MKLRAAMLPMLCTLSAGASAGEFSGSVRLIPEMRKHNSAGLLALASNRLGGDAERVTSELELVGAFGPVSGATTLRHLASEGAAPQVQAQLNELQLSAQVQGWYLTAGKRILSWDVGYGFRPLDVIQQEDRRMLVSTRPQGVPLLAAEHFGESVAISMVLANPHRDRHELGNDAPSLATRLYWRDGQRDWHAVLRYAEETGWRGGLAIAQVVSDSLELHASLLRAERLDLRPQPANAARDAMAAVDGGWQALVGASWTGANKISVLAELWHDAQAWSPQQWRAWSRGLQRLNAAPIDTALKSSALAGEARALASTHLHRDNALLRVAYGGIRFSPSLDVLYTLADGGMVATARCTWQGTRTQMEAGWRNHLGPRAAVARQFPSAEVVYLAASVSF